MIYLVYFLLATPVEFLVWFVIRTPPQGGWLLFLNCGSYVEAAVILAGVSILKPNVSRRAGSEGVARKRTLLVFGSVTGGFIAFLLWWYFFSWIFHGFTKQYFVPGSQPWSGGYYRGQLGAVITYYRFFSIFIALYLAIVAVDLLYRNLEDDSLSSWALRGRITSAGAFVWTSAVTWLVLYRLSEWLFVAALLISGASGASLDASYLSFFPLITTSIACIPVSFWLYRRQPRTRKSSILSSQIASLLIPILAMPLLLPGGFLIFGPIAFCLWTFNAAGFAWGWITGDLRWRSLELQKSLVTTK